MVSAIQESAGLVIGAVAFVATSAYSVLSIPLLTRLIVRSPGKRLLLTTYFICGIIMCIAWLIYLWPLENLFVRISLGLQVLTDAVLLLQVMLLRRRMEYSFQNSTSYTISNGECRKSEEE